MALYVSVSLNVRVADDSDLTNAKINSADSFTDSTTYTEVTSNRIVIADGATDETLPFVGVSSGKFLYLLSDQAVSIKLNGSNDALAVAANMPLFLPATLTACTVTNSSGSAANIDYGVSG